MNLKIFLAQRDIRQSHVAQATGISRKRINRIANGHTQARPEEQKALSKALGVEVSDLFGSELILPGELTEIEVKRLVRELLEDERALWALWRFSLRIQALAGGSQPYCSPLQIEDSNHPCNI